MFKICFCSFSCADIQFITKWSRIPWWSSKEILMAQSEIWAIFSCFSIENFQQEIISLYYSTKLVDHNKLFWNFTQIPSLGPSINDDTHFRGRGDLPKGDVALQTYLVKWVIRTLEGSKISKMGDIIYGCPPYCGMRLMM